MESTRTYATQARPLIFGEVLFDAFPDGQAVMGGAPFNVAWHLQGFGAKPLLISRVGCDRPGQTVLDSLRDWGMDATGIQVDADLPTGRVQIALHDGTHSFDILTDQAYDRIDAQTALDAARAVRPALLYCGSLITRAAASRAALTALREAVTAPLFVDINLREPWWERTRVETLMQAARWLKLNDDELTALRGPSDSLPAAEAQAAHLREACGLDWVILTRGVEGASCIGPETLRGQAPAVTQLVDSVGAGDAFSAVTLLGLLRGWDWGLTLSRALGFAARICEQRGATQPDAALYAGLREAWKL
ncbi:MAG: PfkB family carbohydrate kinase [Gammaproteobacteria bacterium]